MNTSPLKTMAMGAVVGVALFTLGCPSTGGGGGATTTPAQSGTSAVQRGESPPPSGGPGGEPRPPQGGPGDPRPPQGRGSGPAAFPRGPAGRVGLEMIPYTEVLAGILAMDSANEPKVAIEADQKTKLIPILDKMGKTVQTSAQAPQNLLDLAARQLTDKQVAYILDSRNKQPSTQPGVTGISASVLKLLEKRAKEPERTIEGNHGDNLLTGPEDLLNGIMRLESSADLKVTPAQAKELIEPIKQLVDDSGDIEARKKELLGVLNMPQKSYIIKAHGQFVTSGTANIQPAEDIIAELLRRFKE